MLLASKTIHTILALSISSPLLISLASGSDSYSQTFTLKALSFPKENLITPNINSVDSGGNSNLANDVSSADSSPQIPTPTIANSNDNNISTTCNSNDGKKFTFQNQDCMNAARVISKGSTPAAQCGKCVIGLYDVQKKKAFTPSGPVQESVLEEQVNNLLSKCSSNPSSDSSQGGGLKSKRNKILSRRQVQSDGSSDRSNNNRNNAQSNNGQNNNASSTVQMIMGYNPNSKTC